MRVILACTDGSAYAPSVYDHTAWAALRMEAVAHVVHTMDPHQESTSLSDLSGTLRLDAQEALLQELVALDENRARVAQLKGKAILEEADRHLRDKGVTGMKTSQRRGALVDVVAELEPSADLVVIGKRGKSADFASLHLGANLERIIRTCHHPVLVASRSFAPVDKFLIAFDGGPSSQKAVAYAVGESLLKGLQCHLLMVGKTTPTPEFNAAETMLRAAGYEVHGEVLPGDPEDVISEAVRSKNIQLLVMGAYGHSRIRHLVLGSTTTTMIRICLVPVLMFR